MADPLLKEMILLYALPRVEFTAARAARSKELRKDSQELASDVAVLPKPSVASEALNALAREDPSEVRALVQSGKRLRTAQEAAVAGKRGKSLSAALDEHRAALERVLRALRKRKLSEPTFERASRTLRAASLDPTLQPSLECGTLSEDVTGAGFGLDPGIVAVRPSKRLVPATKPKTDLAAARKRERAREQLQIAERELRDAEKQAATALDEHERAKRTHEQARRRLTASASEKGQSGHARLKLRERRLPLDAKASDPSRGRPVEARIVRCGVEEDERERVLEPEPPHLTCRELGVQEALAFDRSAEPSRR